MTPWDWRPINRLATVTLGKMVQWQPKDGGDIERPYVRAAHIQPLGKWFDASEKTMYFSPTEAAELDVCRGDVLVVEGGAGYGRSFYVSQGLTGWGFQNSINRLRPYRSRCDGRFLAYALQDGLTSGRVELAASVATIPHFTAEKVSSFLVPAPDVHVQLGIAEYLDRETAKIDAIIVKKKQLVATLLEHRSALVASSVTRGIEPACPTRESGVGWIGAAPTGWTVGNIRRYAQMKTGHTPSRSHAEYWEDCTIPWFTLADVWQIRDERQIYLGPTKERISQVGLENSAADLLPAGTVVFSRTASVGFSGIMQSEMATSQDFWNWVCRPNLLPTFLLYVFRAMSHELRAIASGSTHQTIYQPVAAAISIPVPPLVEQRAIVEFLTEATARVDALIDKVRELIDVMKERRAALISAAVTGQIDVSDYAKGA